MGGNESIEMKEVYVVTGSAGLVGRAVVAQLLAEGCFVVGASRRQGDSIDSLNGHYVFESVDFGALETIGPWLRSVSVKYGKVRGLVHCAGHDRLFPLYLARGPELIELFSVHAGAAICMASALSKRGVAAPGCSVVLVSSLAAHEGATAHAAYAAAKGAVEGFLRPAAAELVRSGIRINCVIPGVLDGGMADGFLSRLTAEQREGIEKSYPLGLGTGEDVAAAVCFLLSGKAKWITGQSLVLDGGHLCRP